MLTPLVDALDPSLYGHKAAHLASLRRSGFDVPDGVVLPVAAAIGPDAVQAALLTLGAGPVAVRSSSVAEDLPDASFAGQYVSVLGVRGANEVCDAIARVRESAASLRVRSYSGDQPGGMAVLIQSLVAGEASGVAFSANPVTGNRSEVVVTATRGLGEALVSGEVVGDEWVVNGDAARAVVETQHAIDAGLAVRIAALARRVEAHLGRPADIEWTVREGQLVLLQARPITVLPVPPVITKPKGTWQKDTTHCTEPITPFGASTYVAYTSPAFRALIDRWGMLVDRIEGQVIGHEIYMHVTPDDGGKTPPPWWVLGALVRVIPAMRKKLRASQAAVDAGLLESIPVSWEAEHRPRIQAELAQLAAIDLTTLDDKALTTHLDCVQAFAQSAMELHFHLTVPYIVGVHEFVTACAELLGMGLPEAMRMLQGLSVASSAPTRELREVAALVAEKPALRAALSQPDVIDRLDADPVVGPAWRAWMGRWGLRTIGYDPGMPSFAERPALLVGLLAELVDGREQRNHDAARAEAVAEARRRLSGPALDRFNRVLAVAEVVYPLREDNVIYTDNMPAGLVRLIGLEMGRRLVAQGRLARATDMAMLSVEEMRSPADLKALVATRRAETAWVRAHPGPLFYGPRPGAAPDLRGLPEASRRFNNALIWAMEEEITPAAPVAGDGLGGLAASPGVATGRVRVILSASQIEDLRPGEILVCPITTPAWTLVFSRAAALVTDGGSVLSHAAIVAREHGLPAVVATGNATRRLRDGQMVTVDGTRGLVIES